jgi:hypothetical protein
MSSTLPDTGGETASETIPSELLALRERIAEQPGHVRAELEPLIEEVVDHAVFRHNVLQIARDALQRFRLEMAAMQFDLDVTRRERDAAEQNASDDDAAR